MPTSYPGAIDNFAGASPTHLADVDTTGRDHAERHDDVELALEAVQVELGVAPSGAAATVVARLDALDTTVAGKVAASIVDAKGDLIAATAADAVARLAAGANGLALVADSAEATGLKYAAPAPAAHAASHTDGGSDEITVTQAQVTDLTTDLAGKVPSAWAAKSSGYTAVPGDHVIDVTGTTTITLPAAASSAGKVYVIRNTGGAAVTIDGNSAELVGGAATQSFTGYGYLRIVCNGTAWLVLDGQYWSETVGRRLFEWDANNARWQTTYADTGWRDVTSSMDVGALTSGSIFIRRIINQVHWAFDYANPAFSSATLWGSVPSGFRAERAGTMPLMRTGSNDVKLVLCSGVTLQHFYNAGENIHGESSYATANAWPSSLPGSASGSIPT